MRADRQQFDAVLVHDAVREQAQLVGHPKFIDADTCEVADLSFTNPGVAGNRLNGRVEISLLLPVQLLGHPLEGWGNKNAHQPN